MKKFLLLLIVFISLPAFNSAQTLTIPKDCFNRGCNLPASKQYKYWKQVTRSTDWGKGPLVKTSVLITEKVDDYTTIDLYRILRKSAPAYEKRGLYKTISIQSPDKSKTVSVNM